MASCVVSTRERGKGNVTRRQLLESQAIVKTVRFCQGRHGGQQEGKILANSRVEKTLAGSSLSQHLTLATSILPVTLWHYHHNFHLDPAISEIVRKLIKKVVASAGNRQVPSSYLLI